MSSKQHTPGPWTIVSTFNASDCDGKLLCSIEGADLYLAEVWGDIGSKEEAEANARLIAAAPDLVAACKMWLAETKWLDADAGTEATAMNELVSLWFAHGMDPLDPASVFIHTFTEAALAKAGVA